MTHLVILVGKGKERVLKEIFKERIDSSFQPFALLAEAPTIEIKMWEAHNNTHGYGTSALRDEFYFLFTLSAVTRSASVYKGDLCDMCYFTFLQQREQDPYHIIILRDSDSKGSKV